MDIPNLPSLSQMSPKAFNQMSSAQIRAMSYRQMNEVNPEQVSKLSLRKKRALKKTRKEYKEIEEKLEADAKRALQKGREEGESMERIGERVQTEVLTGIAEKAARDPSIIELVQKVLIRVAKEADEAL